MAGYAEAGAELPSPFNIPFRIWLKLPTMARGVVALLILYPVVAFLSVVTVFQILSHWIDMDPVQRYALRGLGIDKQNLIDTSSVIDTVSLVNFESDVAADFDSIYIKRGQVVGLVAQLRAGGKPRQQLQVCLQPLNDQPSDGAEIGTFEVSVVRSSFTKKVPLQFSTDMQVRNLISPKDWRESEELEGFDSNDDVRVNISYRPGAIYTIPPQAKTVAEITPGTPAAVNPALACQKYKVLANIRIAKPELLLNR